MRTGQRREGRRPGRREKFLESAKKNQKKKRCEFNIELSSKNRGEEKMGGRVRHFGVF